MKRISLLLVVIGSLLISKEGRAQQSYEEYTNVLNGVSRPFADGDTLTVIDTLMTAPSAKPTVLATNEIVNIISLSFNEPYLLSTANLPDSFTVNVEAKVYVQQSPELAEVSTTRSFAITYSKNHPYKKADIFYFNNGRKVKIEIMSVTPAGIADNIARGLLLLSNDMRISRDYDINCGSCGLTGFGSYAASLTDATDILPVSWGANPAAELYDLEWVYIDSAAYDDNPVWNPWYTCFCTEYFPQQCFPCYCCRAII
jgi:hypothetical protein